MKASGMLALCGYCRPSSGDAMQLAEGLIRSRAGRA